MTRWARAVVDLDAITHNVEVLRRAAAPAAVWAVVKANGYGHGAVRVAEAALQAGAAGLCVALAQEGVELREAGIDAPILVLTEQPPDAIGPMIAHRLVPTVYSEGFANLLAAVAADPLPVHVKVDTGMQRVGIDAEHAVGLVAHVRELAPRLELAGLFTHLACADEPDRSANSEQLDLLDRVLAELGPSAPSLVHAANSAATLAIPRARRSLVRCGIAMYGVSPGAGIDRAAGDVVGELRPAMRLVARVAHVKRVAAGSHVSYGWRHRFDRDTTVATVPIGYADGVPRRLGTLPDRPGADVLIGARPHPIVGVVTMDQLVVDVGETPVAVGDEAVLIGEQGGERVRAEDWAERLGTIGYEIVCGIGARVPRVVAPRRDRS